ncbi:unnamed protein product [Cyprideis torosa]|uniref:NADH dehydrogenase [ubiquinone] 1 beta subcomplex subunit 7 n=1 Tax=Cyprideis torosa TaxID=163714 RepID=A0A7R8WGT3_9CRUS|nr:unnamed protein product [Cyprideis torosa]CAG0892983.1 unnamed protein product [Cyprideis torosa]
MDSAQVPSNMRNPCVGFWMKMVDCQREFRVTLWNCQYETHALRSCEKYLQDLAMMEYERERRLLQRVKKIEQRRLRSGFKPRSDAELALE